MELMDDYWIDTILFLAVGSLAWLGAALWDQTWLVLFGLPWLILGIVSLWRTL